MFLKNGNSYTDDLDRGLQFGDGHFTTLRFMRGQPLWWQLHWQRLAEACQRLSMPQPNKSVIEQWLMQAIDEQQHGVAKIIMTRGSGGRGYTLPEKVEPAVYITTSALPTTSPPVERIQVAELALARQPVLAGLKTLNRLEQVMLANERQRRQLDDLLILDQDGYLIETCQGNLFWRCGSQWFTPSLEYAGINGVARQLIITEGWLGDVVVGNFILADLAQAEQVFYCNSVRGAVPIGRLNDRVLTTQLPDVLTQIIA